MTLKEQYRRERRRIQRTKRNYEKRGIDVNISIPHIPKKITAGSVRRLKKISLHYIREHSQAPDYETGEVIGYYRFIRQERKLRKESNIGVREEAPTSWQLALQHLGQILMDYDDRAEALYRDRINQYITQYGEKVLGMAVERLINEGKLPEPKESYNIGYILVTLSYLDAILNADVQFQRKILSSIDDSYFEEYEGEFDEW